LIIHISLALAVILFAETIGTLYIQHYLNIDKESIGDAMFVFRFSVLATIITILSIPFQGLITAQEKFAVNSTIEIIVSILKLCVAIILMYYLKNRLRLYAELMALVISVPSILYFLYCRKKFAPLIAWNFQKDKSKYGEMVSFTGWILLGASASIGMLQGAALIINSFFGTLMNASFGIANQLNSFILMFSRNLSQAAIPQITKSFSEGNSNRTIQLVSYISKYSFFLLLLPALPILLETDFILKLWLGEVPEFTSVFCQLMIINALVDGISSGIPAAIHATGKIKYFQIILSSLSLLSLPIAFITFKMGYPPYSILTIYILTSSINVVVMQILLKTLINFNINNFIKTTYSRILYVVASVIPLYYIKNLYPESLTRFILTTILSVTWFLIVVYFIGLENRERALITSFINKSYLKFKIS